MAKVIKVEPPATLLVKHSECGATIQYELSEIKEKIHSDYRGDGEMYCHAVCPHCGRNWSWYKK